MGFREIVKKYRVEILAACLCMTWIFFSAGIYAAESERITPAVKAVAKAMPSVVNISTDRKSTGTQALFKRSEENELEKLIKEKEASLGSGCIIDEAGLILSNSHVISGATQIWVTTNDNQQYSAEEVARDEINDLSLLRLLELPSDKKLKAIKIAPPGDLMLGEPVIIIGNPYGLGSSVSMGILSAVGRKVVYKGKVIFSDIIQTDAAVYPGCSGGPLVNIDGDLIGINTAMHKEAGGIGFAIPLTRIENVLARWLVPETFNNASLGFIPALKRMDDGVIRLYVAEVLKDSPAWKSGIRGGEMLMKYDGEPLGSDLMRLSRRLWRLKAGETITLQSEGNKDFRIKLEERKTTVHKILAASELLKSSVLLQKY